MDAETFQKVKSDFSKKKAYEIDPLYGVGDANLKAAQETCGQTCAPAPSEYRPQDVQKQIIQSLLVNKDNADDQSKRSRKSLQILEAHPEFLDFIELIRLGQVSLY
jgi:hypothetical protein